MLLKEVAKRFLSNIRLYSRVVLRRPLYAYQLPAAQAIIDSVIRKRGFEFAILFPRQSGKNEVQSHLQAYLLTLFQRVPGAQIVVASPTFQPQAINSITRLETQLCNNWTAGQWKRSRGYIITLGEARALFFSAEPSANVVGATANILLIADESQDIIESEWAKKFEPMTAARNATIAHFGTSWTSDTLLSKTIRRLRALQERDGVQRVFIVDPDTVALENPDYALFVEKQIEKYGRHHPFVKTQLFNEEIDGEAGMFPPARRALLVGTHRRQDAPTPGRLYAFAVDVAGADEADTRPEAAAAQRDSTILRIAEVDTSTRPPTYRTVSLLSWANTKQHAIIPIITALIRQWQPAYIVADATGIGAALSSFLLKQFGDRVIPFTFTAQSKSQLGWDYLAMTDTGRLLSYADSDAHAAAEQEQLTFCRYEIIPGPARLMRWSVPDGTRNPATGLLVHDDYLTTAALLSVLDNMHWITPTGPALLAHRPDPLAAMSKGF